MLNLKHIVTLKGQAIRHSGEPADGDREVASAMMHDILQQLYADG